MAYEGQNLDGTWNADVAYPPALIGCYTARHRHDMDKQEVRTWVRVGVGVCACMCSSV